MSKILLEYCHSTIKSLHARFQASEALSHSSLLGTIREQAISDLLKDHLPSLVRVVSGQVFDRNDNRSTQQDVILVQKSVPRLPFASGIDLVYVEGVIATLEIKSSLSAPVLKDVGAGIGSVRALQPSIWGTSKQMSSNRWPAERILCGILTYKASSFGSLATVMGAMPQDHLPDFILDLSVGIMVQNHGLLLEPVNNGSPHIEIPDPALGLMLFLTFLTEITATIGMRGINWRSYLG